MRTRAAGDTPRAPPQVGSGARLGLQGLRMCPEPSSLSGKLGRCRVLERSLRFKPSRGGGVWMASCHGSVALGRTSCHEP